jgi:endonuclease/exonuclease/phosphatase family metal-dependent hydrolase
MLSSVFWSYRGRATKAAVLALSLGLFGCAQNQKSAAVEGVAAASSSSVEALRSSTASGTIKIASFNIQVFGVTKREDADVMSVLVRVARKFDVLAIQEVRDSTDETIYFYVNEINRAEGVHYKAISGPRLGRSSSKEQYAILYNTDRVEYVAGSAYTYADRSDQFEREPLLARFRAGSFSFVLADIHTKPSDATAEIDALDDVADDALHHFAGEKDIIVLGDFNGDCSNFNKNRSSARLRASKYLWIVPDTADTTTRGSTDCAYDRIVTLKSGSSEDYDGRWGIERFDTDFQLSGPQTLKVSDHFPVWAEFTTSSDTDGGPSS